MSIDAPTPVAQHVELLEEQVRVLQGALRLEREHSEELASRLRRWHSSVHDGTYEQCTSLRCRAPKVAP